jgi:WD40 repeat protein
MADSLLALLLATSFLSSPTEARAGTDRFGDPLPPGALARLGTVRFRHGQVTKRIAFSPNGKLLLSANSRNGIRLWDAASGRLLNSFPEPRGVWDLAFTPDSKALFAANAFTGEGPRLVSAATGQELRRFKTRGQPSGLALSADGKKVAAGDGDEVAIWDVASAKELHRLEDVGGIIYTVAFSPDGKCLVAGTVDGAVLVWDFQPGKVLHRLKLHKSIVWSVCFSHDGKLLASASEDGTICVRNMPDATARWRCAIKAGMYSLAFSPDGTQLASGGLDGCVRLFEPGTGKEMRQWRVYTQSLQCVTFSPDGKVLATAGGWDHAIRLWDPATERSVHPVVGHTGTVDMVRFTPDGKGLTSWGRDRKLLTWDLARGIQLGKCLDVPADLSPPGVRALSPGGEIFAVAEHDNGIKQTIQLWNTRTGQKLHTLRRHDNLINSVAFSPDGKRLVSAGDDSRMCLWDVQSGQKLFDKAIPCDSVTFSPTGSNLTALGTDGRICLFDAADLKEIRRWSLVEEPLQGLASSGDGTLLASRSPQAVHVWHVASGKEYRRLSVEIYKGNFALSPDGRYVATTHGEYQALPGGGTQEVWKIEVWELASGRVVWHSAVPEGWFWCLAFASDGRTLATGSGNSDILIWDLTGRMRGRQLQPAHPTAAELQRYWTELAGDGPRASAALWALVAAPEQAVQLLAQRLHTPPAPDPERVAQLISDLDDKRFDTRQRATHELRQLAELAEAQLEKAGVRQGSLEFRKRLEQLRDYLAGPITEPDRLRTVRAVEVLEQIATPEARRLLHRISVDTPDTLLARTARKAVIRLARQALTPP